MSGFSSGEACFIVDIIKSKSNKIGNSVNLRVMISQHARDELLLCSLINYFNCGKLYKNNNCFNLTIRKFADIDTNSQAFRYPVDKDGKSLLRDKSHLQNISYINLQHLAEKMAAIAFFLNESDMLLITYPSRVNIINQATEL